MRKIYSIALALTLAFSANANAENFEINKDAYQGRLDTAILKFQNSKYDSAFNDLLKFAKAGDKLSQYLVGTMYLKGQGTKINSLEGYVWINVAVEQRDRSWLSMLEKLDERISDEFKEAAKPLIADYITRYGVEAQKLRCKNRRETGSNRKKHVCEKVETRPGFFYVGRESDIS